MTSALGEGTLEKHSCFSEKLTEPSLWPNGAWEKAPSRVTHFSTTTNQHDGTNQGHRAGPLVVRVSEAPSDFNWNYL